MTTERHTRVFPGREARGDALDLLKHEAEVLRRLIDEWRRTDPDSRESADEQTLAAWDHGIVGKLFVEHGSMLVSAEEFVASVLTGAGHEALAGRLTERTGRIRQLVDRLYEHSRGTDPIPTVRSQDFSDLVGDLEDLLRPEISTQATLIPEIEHALGRDRAHLPSAKYVRQRSPSHRKGDVTRHPALVRVQTMWEHLRGHPWVPRPQADRILGGDGP